MKKLLAVVLISLVCFSNQIEKELFTGSFDNDQDAQDTVEYTMCSLISENEEFLQGTQELIDEGEYPEGSDLQQIAFSVCSSFSQSIVEFKDAANNLVRDAREGKSLLLYKKPVKDIKDILEPTPTFPIPIREDDIILKKNELKPIEGEPIKVEPQALSKGKIIRIIIEIIGIIIDIIKESKK